MASESTPQAKDSVSHELAHPLDIEGPSPPTAISHSFIKKHIPRRDLEREMHWNEEGGSNLTSVIWSNG